MGLRKKTEQKIVVGKLVFGNWQRSARRQQIQIAPAACALVMTTEKVQMFSNTLSLKNAVLKPVRTPVAILGSLGVCIYVPASRHWLISYSPIHLI